MNVRAEVHIPRFLAHRRAPGWEHRLFRRVLFHGRIRVPYREAAAKYRLVGREQSYNARRVPAMYQRVMTRDSQFIRFFSLPSLDLQDLEINKDLRARSFAT